MAKSLTRRCSGQNAKGEPCGFSPQRDSDLCWWHDPAHAEEAREARRLGGVRRRREGVVQGSYDFVGLTTIPDLQRLLEIIAIDTLALDNSVARSRTMVAVVQAAAKLLEIGDFAQRLEALEDVVTPRLHEVRRTG
jgi:hypothetical protein